MTLEVGKKYHDETWQTYHVIISSHMVEGIKFYLVEQRYKINNSLHVFQAYSESYFLNFIPYTPKKTLKRYGYFRNCRYANTKDRCLCLFFELESVRDANFSTDNDAVPGSKFEVSVEVDVN